MYESVIALVLIYYCHYSSIELQQVQVYVWNIDNHIKLKYSSWLKCTWIYDFGHSSVFVQIMSKYAYMSWEAMLMVLSGYRLSLRIVTMYLSICKYMYHYYFSVVLMSECIVLYYIVRYDTSCSVLAEGVAPWVTPNEKMAVFVFIYIYIYIS